jgi:hypothetical protein
MKKIMIICMFFILVSCGDPSKSTDQVKFDQKTFVEQRQLWQESNVKKYRYQLSAIGFIPYDGIIFVENGNFKSDLPSSGQSSEISNFLDYSTIDEIYKTIEKNLNYYNNTEQSENAYYFTEIAVEYDKINHIPIEIIYYYYAPPNLEVDWTFYYEITEFNKMS